MSYNPLTDPDPFDYPIGSPRVELEFVPLPTDEELAEEVRIEPEAQEHIRNAASDILTKSKLEDQLFKDLNEMLRKADRWPSYNSAHEGYGVLMEEFDELKEHIYAKQSARDINQMRLEAIDVAVVALRFARDVCNEEVGRK